MASIDKKMVWLDTDIGTDIDDALALAYLLSRTDVDLLGISTVTVSVVDRAKLAAAICRDFGREHVRVFTGADQRLMGEARQYEYPQTAAVTDEQAKAVEEQIAKSGAAVEAMYRAALRWPGEVNLIAIGPLTNLALLVATHPDVADLLASVTLMAGRYYGPAWREWNVWCDPHAAAIVFSRFRNIRAVGLDVTTKTTRPAEEILRIFGPASQTVARAIEIFMKKQNHQTITLHDPLAVASLFEPDILKFERGTVQIETSGQHTEGVSVFRPSDDGPHQVAKSIDLARFNSHYEQVLSAAGRTRAE